MTDIELLKSSLQGAIDVYQAVRDKQVELLVGIATKLGDLLEKGGTIYLCGNGGSAADAQHIAAEFVGRFLKERRALPAVALTTNTSILTAIGNDYDFSQIFSRQVKAMVNPKDALVGISTSGRSANVLEAIREAKKIGALTVAFTGFPGEPMDAEADLAFRAPSQETPRIQEVHIAAWHGICDLIERRVHERENSGLSGPGRGHHRGGQLPLAS
ncbi:MAG: SIS domain-containing protein [Gemmataceae bacterium]|nr:SIS domain-containing protein [Gemmataceae bacterium]